MDQKVTVTAAESSSSAANNTNNNREEAEKLKFPVGFRFYPTDEELIVECLTKKVKDKSFSAIAIGEVDFNKIEPWLLHKEAKMAKKGENEWYFFTMRDKKYPTGSRTNRATQCGYWKATGKDKEIFKGGKSLIGMKKTLVFYKGRAPRGQKTNWVMHEFRLEGHYAKYHLPKSEWALSRVSLKKSSEKKVKISEEDDGNNKDDHNKYDDHDCCLCASSCDHTMMLPPLMEASPQTEMEIEDSSHSHVTCFSNNNNTIMEHHQDHQNMMMMMMPTPGSDQSDGINIINNNNINNPPPSNNTSIQYHNNDDEFMMTLLNFNMPYNNDPKSTITHQFLGNQSTTMVDDEFDADISSLLCNINDNNLNINNNNVVNNGINGINNVVNNNGINGINNVLNNNEGLIYPPGGPCVDIGTLWDY